MLKYDHIININKSNNKRPDWIQHNTSWLQFIRIQNFRVPASLMHFLCLLMSSLLPLFPFLHSCASLASLHCLLHYQPKPKHRKDDIVHAIVQVMFYLKITHPTPCPPRRHWSPHRPTCLHQASRVLRPNGVSPFIKSRFWNPPISRFLHVRCPHQVLLMAPIVSPSSFPLPQ